MDKKIALVTGGVGGIGTAICKKLAREGHFVVANYAIAGTEERWRQAMAAAGLNGSSSALAFGDVADYEAMGKMIRAIESDHGCVDILVNCAGITRDSTFRKMTPEQWRAVLSTNLDSVFNVTRHVIDAMIERNWGRKWPTRSPSSLPTRRPTSPARICRSMAACTCTRRSALLLGESYCNAAQAAFSRFMPSSSVASAAAYEMRKCPASSKALPGTRATPASSRKYMQSSRSVAMTLPFGARFPRSPSQLGKA